jgi:hypothetical protein
MHNSPTSPSPSQASAALFCARHAVVITAGADGIAVRQDWHHAARMAKPGSASYVAPELLPRRVVVRASGLARRGYVWEIVKGISVEQTSARSFSTMEEAFSEGAAVLATWDKP